MLVYEFLITLESEVMLFWMQRPVNGASILFVLNRYIALVVQILGWSPLPASYQVGYSPLHLLL